MSAAPAFRFAYDGDDLVIRVPKGLITPDRVSRFFDELLLEEGSRELTLAEEEVAALSDEVDNAAWERLCPMEKSSAGDERVGADRCGALDLLRSHTDVTVCSRADFGYV